MIRFLDPTKDLRLYRELCADIYSGKCILFSSLGLSAQAQTKSGEHPPSHLKSLFEGVVNWCVQADLMNQQEKAAFYRLFRAKLTNREEIAKARYILEEYLIDKPQQQRCLRKVLLCDQAEVSSLHYLLTQIPFRAYVTTNYDTFIENAYYAVHQKPLPKFDLTSISYSLETYQNEQPFILKLNGDIENSDSLIFSIKDLKRSQIDNAPSEWKTHFSGFSVLFIGFEQDILFLDTLQDLFGTTVDLTYWVVLPKSQISRSKANQRWKNNRINIIQYEPDEAQFELKKFLEKLAPPGKPPPAWEWDARQIKHSNPPKGVFKGQSSTILEVEDVQEIRQPEEKGLTLLKPIKAVDVSPCSCEICTEGAATRQSNLTGEKTFAARNLKAGAQLSRTYAPDVLDGDLRADVVEGNSEAVKTSVVTTKSGTRTAIEVFFSYAYIDKAMQIELFKHLKIMKFKRKIIWHDKEISAGKEKAREIEKLLDTVHIILLLVSVDFLTSLGESGVEMKQALRRHKEGKARVIPIILRPVYWHDAPFKKLQVLPANQVPMTSWSNLEEAYVHVATEVRKAIDDFIGNHCNI